MADNTLRFLQNPSEQWIVGCRNNILETTDSPDIMVSPCSQGETGSEIGKILPYTCPHPCSTCFPQYFPVARQLDDKEAGDLISTLTQEVLSSHETLVSAVEADGDGIARRWKRWSIAKRRDCLNAENVGKLHPTLHGARFLIPPLFTSNDPKATATHVEKTATDFLDTWLVPWLDQGILSESPLSFLKLLHLRSSHHPAEWVTFDYKHSKLAIKYGVLNRYYNEHCIDFSPDNFGKMVKWDKDRIHRREIFGYKAAVYILSAMKSIYTMLSRVIGNIQHDLRGREQKHREQADGAETATATKLWSILCGNNFTSFNKLEGSLDPPELKHMTGFSPPTPGINCNVPESVLGTVSSWTHQLDNQQTHEAIKKDIHQVLDLVRCTSGYDLSTDRTLWMLHASVLLVHPLFTRLTGLVVWESASGIAKLCDEVKSSAVSIREDLIRTRDSGVCILVKACRWHLAEQLVQLQAILGLGRCLAINEGRELMESDPLFWSLYTMGYDDRSDSTLDLSICLDLFHTYLQKKMTGSSVSGWQRLEKSGIGQHIVNTITNIQTLNEVATTISCSQGWDPEINDERRSRAELVELIDKAPHIVAISRMSNLRELVSTKQNPANLMALVAGHILRIIHDNASKAYPTPEAASAPSAPPSEPSDTTAGNAPKHIDVDDLVEYLMVNYEIKKEILYGRDPRIRTDLAARCIKDMVRRRGLQAALTQESANFSEWSKEIQRIVDIYRAE